MPRKPRPHVEPPPVLPPLPGDRDDPQAGMLFYTRDRKPNTCRVCKLPMVSSASTLCSTCADLPMCKECGDTYDPGSRIDDGFCSDPCAFQFEKDRLDYGEEHDLYRSDDDDLGES
jgi:hypothetical protein